MKQGFVRQSLFTSILYIFGFLLLWEWLRPLAIVTDTGGIHYFVIFIAMALTLYYFRVHPAISATLKTLFILFALHVFYFEEPLLGFSWIGVFIEDIIRNIGLTFSRDWPSLSFLYRSFLFFVLLWLLTYLIHYWISVRKKLLLFYAMSVIYVTVLDTFTEYEGENAIVRVVIFGFLLLGLLALERVTITEKILGTNLKKHRWITPLIVMIGFSSVVAYAAPKAEPIWPDPVPYIKSYASDSGGVSKIGYDSDDSQLGGPFVGDPTLVFSAEVINEHYWRIESKNVYTGKGWEASEEEDAEVDFISAEPVPLEMNLSSSERNLVEERIIVEKPYPHVVYPYGLETVLGNEDGYYRYNQSTGKINTYEGQEEVSLSEYAVTYRSQTYSQKAMQAATGTSTDEYMIQHTQLPDTLPQRVQDLALEITAGKDNWFDKAKAVEEYFEKEGFVYDQWDVGIPGENQDYVDQFLFETQRGYCDNFSTSMVVLLRSIDIPARWVKGYTEGDYARQLDSVTRLYEVTNNNAHSWVEVFFPEVGWVPFEPTVGFNSNVIYDYDLELPESSGTPVPEVEEQPKPDKNLQPEDTEESGSSEFSFKQMFTDIQNFIEENIIKVAIVLIALVALGIYLFMIRRRWIPFFLVRYYRSSKKEEAFSDAYLALLKQFDRYGLRMEDGQTLRGFARYIDAFFGTREMTSLTSNYEKMLYGQKLSQDEWEKMREKWENLIKRTTG